jgi:hypothetical protein
METLMAVAVVVLGAVFVAKMFSKDKHPQAALHHSTPATQLELDDDEEAATLRMNCKQRTSYCGRLSLSKKRNQMRKWLHPR